jgi:hypothetical protein
MTALQVHVTVSTLSVTAAADMADVNWKAVVDMEMHDFRVDISQLKATVAQVGAAVTGFQEQMRSIAANMNMSRDEGEHEDMHNVHPDDSGNPVPAAENHFTCPQ